MEIKIIEGKLQIRSQYGCLNRITASLFYDGPTYNVLSENPHGEWTIVEKNGTYYAQCQNLCYEIKETNDGLLLRATYRNDTGRTLTSITSFDVLRAEWPEKIALALANTPISSGGAPFAEMGSPVIKRKLSVGEGIESADFTLFSDEKKKLTVFGFASFEEYFSTVYVNQEGYLVASCITEYKSLLPDETITSDWLFLCTRKASAEAMLKKYTDEVFEHTGKRKPLPSIDGYCTWYYYGPNITEEIVLRELESIKKHPEIPYRLLQIDDGWFLKRGDYRENSKFHSMKSVAEKIREAGLIPGLWIHPHRADEDSALYRDHPDWFVRTLDGKANHPTHALDFSHPEAAKWLFDLFHTITAVWGYQYLKVDLIAPALCYGKYHDPSFNSLKNYRTSLRIIRQAVGENVFVLACSSPLMSSIGLADGVRTSVDIFERYSSLLDVYSRSLNRSYLSPLIANDPDCLLLREKEEEGKDCFRNCVRTPKEIETYLTAALASGGPLIQSDRLDLLSPSKYRLLSKLFPHQAKAATLPTFLEETIPSVLDFGRKGNFRVIAYTNWGEKEKTFVCHEKGHIFEFFSRHYLGVSKGKMTIDVPPHETRLLWICKPSALDIVGSDGSLLPSFVEKRTKNGIVISKQKSDATFFVFAKKDLKGNASIEKIGKNQYRVRGLSERKIILHS